MEKVFEFFGGRKMTIVLLLIILLALKNVLDLDEKIINLIVTTGLGGVAGLTITDSVEVAKGVKPGKIKATQLSFM